MAAGSFPVGESVDPPRFHEDPYPWYRRMLADEPVSWVPAFGMYLVTPAALCREVLRDDRRFVVGFERSTVHDILGEHMMSVDGDLARRLKRAHQPPFLPGFIRDHLDARITAVADRLIDSFAPLGEVELRSGFASRLPVLVMLAMFGLHADDELLVRRWYDTLEAALANTGFEPTARQLGKDAAAEFHLHVRGVLDELREARRPGTMLDDLVHAPAAERLTDDEIAHNAGIVLFGGISTVEALVLDVVWALAAVPGALVRAGSDPAAAMRALHETIRWQSPVQVAHRMVADDVELAGVPLRRGDTVACVLAAANRDPEVFTEPDRFDPDRADAHQHLGFAAGQHHCLGSHLALAEGRIALARLVARLPGLRTDPRRPSAPVGSEFRQPDHLWVVWDTVPD